jgi:hypothetical protein
MVAAACNIFVCAWSQKPPAAPISGIRVAAKSRIAEIPSIETPATSAPNLEDHSIVDAGVGRSC